jgi:hypothetical protein
MKRLFLFTLIGIFVMAYSAVYAAEKASLGNGNIAVKVDYITFRDDDLKEFDADKGLYVGLEGYGRIAPNLYLGMEIGYANPDGRINTIDTELTFIPVELNLKLSNSNIEDAPNLTIDFGAGVSYNYAKVVVSVESFDEDDWLFGGQIFVDLSYKLDRFFVGINSKYQVTEKAKYGLLDVNFQNWRFGAQVGMIF